ncbi:MAG: PAC2 family protein [Thermoplasmata archaeon]|nr:PAC2 family protein [Thermoplasmata archaeon]
MDDIGDIKIYELKKMDLTGAVIIEGFPSVGLVSSIVADYIITALELEQIGIIDSERFPTISLVRNGTPHNPVRIYGGSVGKEGGTKLVVFISEFQPPQGMIRAITSTVLDWMQEQKCTLLISPEGFVLGEPSGGGDREDADEEDIDDGGDMAPAEMPDALHSSLGSPGPSGDEEITERLAKAIDEMRQSIITYGVGSTDSANALLDKYNVPRFEEGVISGVSGVLLNEGKRRGLQVLCLLAEAHPDYPDARAAAKIIETIDSILLKIELDPMPLYAQAIAIEKHIQLAQKVSEARKGLAAPVYGYG